MIHPKTCSPMMLSLVCLLVLSHGSRADSIDISSLRVASDKISVSGVSAGAYMAVQLHVAYSSLFMGAGAVAGGPFYCSGDRGPDDITSIKLSCMMGVATDPTALSYIHAAEQAASDGKIDPIDNLKDDRIYIFNSQTDQVINPLLGYESRRFYEHFTARKSQVAAWAFIKEFGPFYPVAHGMPVTKKAFDDYQNFADQFTPCSPSNTQQISWFPNPFLRGNDPWLYHCDTFLFDGYDLARDILEHIYQTIKKPTQPDREQMFRFKQLDQVADPGVHNNDQLHQLGLGSWGYVYLPKQCQNGTVTCKLHVALHGCQQFPEWKFTGKIGSDYAGETITFGGIFRDSIYNGLAESNDIVMVYPQAHNIGDKDTDLNPYGCWEFWPFTEQERDTYYTKEGRQMKFLANIVKALQDKSIVLETLP